MYVWEKGGQVWFREYGGSTWTLLIDISDEVGNWGDHGLLGFALDPNFDVNGRIYLMYVVDRYALFNLGTPGYDPTTNNYYSATIGRITQYTARSSDGFSSVDPASRLVLLGETPTNGIPITYTSHGVGTLLFGEDGTLLASCGESASFDSTDTGSASETYYLQALANGIIQPKENVGAYRAQLVDSLSGKILRLDPATGNGVPGNPFYDPAHPRAARSRVWALGLRNPYRMTLRPNTGSHNLTNGNPGVLCIGHVGWSTWEGLDVCTRGGQNFGWPVFEGIQVQPSYANVNVQNRDAPNPLYPGSGCSQYFNFTDLLAQNTSVASNQPPFPNPCNLSQKIPSAIPQFLVTPPVLDWEHATTLARTWIYDSKGVATPIDVGAAGSPVSGSMFPGNCSVGGVWFTTSDFTQKYSNTYFHADYGANWIKNFVFDTNNNLVSVAPFLDDGGGIVDLATHPIDGGLYYIDITAGMIWDITRSVNGMVPPIAVAAANQYYGPGPLTVQFNGSASSDPQGFPLAYAWNFGDGTPGSTSPNPSHVFNASPGVPTSYTVSLSVTNAAGEVSTTTLLISVNNTPPMVTISSPVDGSKYSMASNTIYNLTANVVDHESPDAQLQYKWELFLHHDNHEHPNPVDTNHITTALITPIGCDGINLYYYRIQLTVTDPQGLSTTRSVSLFPDCGTPDLPAVISSIPDQTIYVNQSTGPVPFTVSDAEIAAAYLQLSATSSAPALVPDTNILFGGSGSNRTVTVSPVTGQTGTATITITVNDGPNNTSTNFELTVLPAARLAIKTIASTSSNLVLTGLGGVPGATYYVMASTNLAPLPMALWQRLSTNLFSGNGNFTNSIPLNPLGPQEFLVVVTTLPAKIPGLVAAYSFDEGTGTTVMDSSGNTNRGTIGSAMWKANGKYGGALMFNGTSSFVTVNDSPSLHLSTGMTLEAWVNPVLANGTWSDVIYKGDNNNDNYFVEGSSPNNGSPVGGGTFGSGTFGITNLTTVGTGALPTNQWSHVAATYNGTQLELYVNGVQISSQPQTGNIMTSTNALQIGGDISNGQYFDGELDEIRVYNLALTAAQIQADMNLPVGNTPTAPANLAATIVSSNQINLSWAAAAAELGVGAYLAERKGMSDTNFVQIGWSKGTNYSDSSLPSGTSFSYRVRAVDRAGDVGPYSNVAQ